MVSIFSPLAVQLVAGEPAADHLIEQLDPPRRAAVLMALLAFVLLGLVLVVCVMIGARWVRHLARHRRGPTEHRSISENRRLRAALDSVLPEAKTDETTIMDPSIAETKIDREPKS